MERKCAIETRIDEAAATRNLPEFVCPYDNCSGVRPRPKVNATLADEDWILKSPYVLYCRVIGRALRGRKIPQGNGEVEIASVENVQARTGQERFMPRCELAATKNPEIFYRLYPAE